MNKSIVLTLLASAALVGCRDEQTPEGHLETGSRSAELPELPHLMASNGAKVRYFKYKNDDFSVWGDSESELAVFVYPIFTGRRSEGLALPHMPTQDVAELFGEELFGSHFSVALKGDVFQIDEIPISRPVDLNSASKWKMTYRGAAFDCGVTRQVKREFTIRCQSSNLGLDLRFNIDRGFTSYQDFCSKKLCTYSLRSSVGIFSPYHLRLLTEPVE